MMQIMVDPLDLMGAIDDSVDNFMYDLADLYDSKLEECSDEFIDSLLEGFAAPIVVCMSGSPNRSGWVVGNGNHRLAVAIAAMIPLIPVMFTDGHDYMLTCVSESGDHPNSGGSYDDDCSCCRRDCECFRWSTAKDDWTGTCKC